MARNWRNILAALGLGFSLISCHSIPTTTGPGTYADSSVNDVSVALTFHVREGSEFDDFIGDRVRRANKAFLGRGLRITDVRIVYDLEATFITWDSETHDVGISISKLEDKIRGQTSSIHIFIVDDIIDVAAKVNPTTTVGFYRGADICTKTLYLTPEAELVTLAHEIGHFFGLSHVKDVWNIMHAPLNDRKAIARFTRKQLETVKQSAQDYQLLCVDSPDIIK